MPAVGKIPIIFFVILIRDPENIPGRKAACKTSPGQAYDSQNELQMRLRGRLDNDRQQIPGRINESRPELNEWKISQEREVTLEALNYLSNDGRIVVGV